MNQADFMGSRIVVEMANNTKEGPRVADDECFRCKRKGHWANECRYERFRSMVKDKNKTKQE